jgi:hypothetical protein
MHVSAILLQTISFQSSAWSREKFYHMIYIKNFSRLYTLYTGTAEFFGKDKLGWDLTIKGRFLVWKEQPDYL